MTSEGERIQGNIKWFSNQKGYGFVTPKPGASITDDVFVHQSSLHCEGYRTVGEGWDVEFGIGLDDEGKVKAENVTAPGGGFCTGPRVPRRHRGNRQPRNENSEGGEYDAGAGEEGMEGGERHHRAPAQKSPPETPWHDSLTNDVKTTLSEKGIRTITGTLDVALGSARIKLGSRGYASMAHADGILVEGSFSFDVNGSIAVDWKNAIEFDVVNNEWKALEDFENHPEIMTSVSLMDDSVIAVGAQETMETLMGDGPTNPKSALEENGFQMRRVVLLSIRRRRRMM